jgi:hypothetical protein
MNKSGKEPASESHDQERQKGPAALLRLMRAFSKETEEGDFELLERLIAEDQKKLSQ